jgi:hypothetical protein
MIDTNTQTTTQNREWKRITLDDIDKQWQESKTVHPAFGRQICHFAAGIEETLKERNYEQTGN